MVKKSQQEFSDNVLHKKIFQYKIRKWLATIRVSNEKKMVSNNKKMVSNDKKLKLTMFFRSKICYKTVLFIILMRKFLHLSINKQMSFKEISANMSIFSYLLVVNFLYKNKKSK